MGPSVFPRVTPIRDSVLDYIIAKSGLWHIRKIITSMLFSMVHLNEVHLRIQILCFATLTEPWGTLKIPLLELPWTPTEISLGVFFFLLTGREFSFSKTTFAYFWLLLSNKSDTKCVCKQKSDYFSWYCSFLVHLSGAVTGPQSVDSEPIWRVWLSCIRCP